MYRVYHHQFLSLHWETYTHTKCSFVYGESYHKWTTPNYITNPRYHKWLGPFVNNNCLLKLYKISNHIEWVLPNLSLLLFYFFNLLLPWTGRSPNSYIMRVILYLFNCTDTFQSCFFLCQVSMSLALLGIIFLKPKKGIRYGISKFVQWYGNLCQYFYNFFMSLCSHAWKMLSFTRYFDAYLWGMSFIDWHLCGADWNALISCSHVVSTFWPATPPPPKKGLGPWT